jgi:hypothetical protein
MDVRPWAFRTNNVNNKAGKKQGKGIRKKRFSTIEITYLGIMEQRIIFHSGLANSILFFQISYSKSEHIDVWIPTLLYMISSCLSSKRIKAYTPKKDIGGWK